MIKLLTLNATASSILTNENKAESNDQSSFDYKGIVTSIIEKLGGVDFKLGCYTHSSDFDFGGTWGLPGFHWNKNYSCYGYSVHRPSEGTKLMHIDCPNCKKKVIIKVYSVKTCRKISIIYGVLTILSCLGVVCLYAFNLHGFFQVWGTIFGITFIYRFANGTYVNWGGGLPKLRNPITAFNGGHKLFFNEY